MPILAGKEIGRDGFTLPNSVVPDEQKLPRPQSRPRDGDQCVERGGFLRDAVQQFSPLAESVIQRACPEDAEKVVVSIKTGIVDMKTFTMDGSAMGVRAFAENAVKILDGKKKKIDLFGIGWVDKNVPIEETVEALAELVDQGQIGGIQLSKVRAETIRRAAKVTRLDMVEAEISLWSTGVFTSGVAETCAELGVVMEAHTPLGTGMLTGRIRSVDDMPPNDYHRHFARFQPENFQKNLDLVSELEKLAVTKGCSTSQLALALIREQSRKPGMPLIIPIFGTSSVDRVKENTAEVNLTAGEVTSIDGILASFPVAGHRYPPAVANLAEY